MNIKFICLTILIVLSTIYISSSNGSSLTYTPIQCDLCQFSVDSLAGLVHTDNLTYTQIDTAMQRLCNSIPSNYSTACNYLLKSAGPIIIEQIVNGTRSEIICSELQICTNVNTIKKECHYQRIEKIVSSSSDKFTQDNCKQDIGCTQIGKYINYIKNNIITNKNVNC